jgi:PAS domain-containing protein
MGPHLITIPSNDVAFREFLTRTLRRTGPIAATDFERRLRRTYPRALVRERGLAGEASSWYVYRDGAWRTPDHDRWWDDPGVPTVEVSADGWIEDANAAALGLLGLDGLTEPRHFTDFVVPGRLDDAMDLFEIVRATGLLEATVILMPTTGDAIAVDVRVAATPAGMRSQLRLAADVDAPIDVERPSAPARVDYRPATDVAFRAYAMRSLQRMPEPIPDGLALRLRRLYPHAQVETTADGWIARRERGLERDGREEWWLAEALPCVRYDAQALILQANDAATEFFGRPLVGHHWQEFVTAGSTDEVAIMLAILGEVGAAESRFRMPRGDGALLEFDSYTVADGDEFTTVFRPVDAPGDGR